MPEEYFLYYEELDWCTYINREGYELWYDPACEIWHKDSKLHRKRKSVEILLPEQKQITICLPQSL